VAGAAGRVGALAQDDEQAMEVRQNNPGGESGRALTPPDPPAAGHPPPWGER